MPNKPQMIKTSDSIRLALATIAILGQPPSKVLLASVCSADKTQKSGPDSSKLSGSNTNPLPNNNPCPNPGSDRRTFGPYEGPDLWDKYRILPQYEKWAWMYQDAEKIVADLNSHGDRYYLEYKIRGGSSHQTLVKRKVDDKIMGIWSPPNHATYILGEIFAFNLARLFERSQWVMPGIRMTLQGPGRQKAKKALSTHRRGRECNRENILKYLEANEYYIVGAYMALEAGKNPEKIAELVDRSHKRRLKRDHFLVEFLSRSNSNPTGKTLYYTPRRKLSALSYKPSSNTYRSTDLEAAKQLSFMMLIDALNSQRDRFGPYGSNMQAMVDNNEMEFTISLVDNGGIADTYRTISLKAFIGLSGSVAVTRFERKVFDDVLALDEFLNKGTRIDFKNFTSEEQLKTALGYETVPDREGKLLKPRCKSNHQFLFRPVSVRWEKRWRAFKQALEEVANHMRNLRGDPRAFFDS